MPELPGDSGKRGSDPTVRVLFFRVSIVFVRLTGLIPIDSPCDDFSKYLSHVYAPDEVRVLKTVVNNEHLYRRWAIAATIGAWSDWHCDAAGYGTFLHMWAGSKIWVLSAMSSRLSLQDLDNFIGHQSIKCMPLLLLPGDQL